MEKLTEKDRKKAVAEKAKATPKMNPEDMDAANEEKAAVKAAKQ